MLQDSFKSGFNGKLWNKSILFHGPSNCCCVQLSFRAECEKKQQGTKGQNDVERVRHRRENRRVLVNCQCGGRAAPCMQCGTLTWLCQQDNSFIFPLMGVVVATGCEGQSRLVYPPPQIPVPPGESPDIPNLVFNACPWDLHLPLTSNSF